MFHWLVAIMSLLEIDDDDVGVIPSSPQTCGPAALKPSSSDQARVIGAVPTAARPFNLDDLFGNTQHDISSSHPREHASGSDCHGATAHGIHTSLLFEQSQTAPHRISVAEPKSGIPARSVGKVDELDNLFSATVSGIDGAFCGATAGMTISDHGIHVGGDELSWDKSGEANLLDLSQPLVLQSYNNAETFLDAFERYGVGRRSCAKLEDNQHNLCNLTRNKDDNKVRARLLSLMNYYDVLGVSSSASVEEIKRSYKRKALELHPDKVGRNQTPEEADLFKIITRAHETLTDSSKRAAYDAEQALRQADDSARDSNNWWQHLSTQ